MILKPGGGEHRESLVDPNENAGECGPATRPMSQHEPTAQSLISLLCSLT